MLRTVAGFGGIVGTNPHPVNTQEIPAMALYFDLKTAAAECSVSIDTLKVAIDEGTLRAKRTGKAGGGKYLVSEAALASWFKSLADA